MFFDAIHYSFRTKGMVRQRAVYIAIGVDQAPTEETGLLELDLFEA